MRILVTGSTGFIGSALASHLAGAGHTVQGLDVRPASSSSIETTVCDLLDAGGLVAAFSRFRPDAVAHLAARIDLDEKRDLGGYAANIDGVRNVIAAIRATPSVGRAVFTSSQLVCRVGYVPRSDTDYAPSTLYGESKVWTEKLVREADGGGVPWCLVRPTTVWGPGMSAHYRRFLRMIERGRYFHIGRRMLFKSYGYVGNVVHQYRALLTAPAERIQGKVFYLADEPPLSLRAWVDCLQRAFGAPPIRTVPERLAWGLAKVGDAVNAVGIHAFPFNSFRLNNVMTEYRFDLSETVRICGPSPYGMEAGVAELVAWFRGNSG
jgi:nucleoside-diphosphate-sugar epimerase